MRMEKVNNLIKREISNIIQFGDINDPRISFVTILSVDVSKDLRHARVRYSVLNTDAKSIKNAKEGLESATGYIRKLIGPRIEMRYTPEIQFIFDKGLQYAAEIDATLEEIKKIDQQ